MTPDLCTLNIDIHTTPAFNNTVASTLLNHVIARADQQAAHSFGVDVEAT